MSIRLIPQLVRDGVESVRQFGLGKTFAEVPAYLHEFIFRTKARSEQAEAFDRTFGTDTAISVMPWDLPSLKGMGSDVFNYGATSGRLIRDILRRIPIATHHFTFVDLGSGKGRALLVASEFPFAKIVGVELSSELYAIAEKNIDLYRPAIQLCRNFELHRENATAFAFPTGPLVLFMFNPFGEETIRRVLENLALSLRSAPRQAFFVYVHDRPVDMRRFDAVAVSTKFLRRTATTDRYSIYEARSGMP
jgi:SAM-dependent methyltransferase